MASSLTKEQYQEFKRRREEIDQDFLRDLSNMYIPFRLPHPLYVRNKEQEEARFREARMKALRTLFGLSPTIKGGYSIDWGQSHMQEAQGAK